MLAVATWIKVKAKAGELPHFDWRLLQPEDFGSGFRRSRDLAIKDFLVKKEVATMALLFRSQKTISDRSNGISLLPDEGTEDAAKGTSEIGPETVMNDQFHRPWWKLAVSPAVEWLLRNPYFLGHFSWD